MMPSLHPFKCHETLNQCEELNTVGLVYFGMDAELNTVGLVYFGMDAVTTWRETHNVPCEILCVSGLWTFSHRALILSVSHCLASSALVALVMQIFVSSLCRLSQDTDVMQITQRQITRPNIKNINTFESSLIL
jgi:hypothetical protein